MFEFRCSGAFKLYTLSGDSGGETSESDSCRQQHTMGYQAVECLIEGRFNVFVGIQNNKMHYIPLQNAVKAKSKISDEWMKIVKILAS